MSKNEIKQRVEVLRLDTGLNKAAFARRLGIDPRNINRILTGDHGVSMDFALAILHEFPDLSAEWLMRGVGDMYTDTSRTTYE